MKAGPWIIPQRLESLIATGIWPARPEQAGPGIKAPIAEEKVRRFAPDEPEIYFYPPRLVSARIAGGETFWTWAEADPSGIDPEASVLIGDFGLGSDAPVILDYRENPADPFVKYLKWGASAAESRWVTGASSFDEFCEMLELTNPPTPLTPETFEAFLQDHRCVMIHFHAIWNGVDHELRKNLPQTLHPQWRGRVAFATFDADPPEHREICRELGILNLPFLAFYRDGELFETRTGNIGTGSITSILEHLVQKPC